MSKLEDLRQIITDDGLDAKQRQTAAEHFIGELVDAVTMPADDDSEVLGRMQPSADSTPAAVFGAKDGESLPVARHEVWKRHRLRAVLARVCDESAHRIERLAACEWMLANYGHSKWRLNTYKAERLLSEVLPATATKWVDLVKPVPVVRPPVELKDVWRL